jgi:aerobic-type carbon monoxide dehydrogenase small subunit (CoxS/CutS family)
MEKRLTFTVNGQRRTVETDPARPLLELLREDLQLTGTKYGCGEGSCGACTVLVDGRSVRSCNTPAGEADGKSIMTIEGLPAGEKLHPVQEAFLAENAYQCGFCTPGMILGIVGLLNDKPDASVAQLRLRVEGHICRCNGYIAIDRALQRLAGEKKA